MGNCTTKYSPEIKVDNNLVAELNTYEVKRKEYDADCIALARDLDIFESDLEAFHSTNASLLISINHNIVDLKHLINTLHNASDKEKFKIQLTLYETDLARVYALTRETHKMLILSKTRLKLHRHGSSAAI